MAVYTSPPITVTDGAEVPYTASMSGCARVAVFESTGAFGWPRNWYFRGTYPSSAQQYQGLGAALSVVGPFLPGAIVGYIELKSAGGDSSTFYVQEFSS